MALDQCGAVAPWGAVCPSAPGHPLEHDWRGRSFGAPTHRVRNPMPTLAVLGALAINWLNTTHTTYLGHDHHCPVETLAHGAPVTPTQDEVERCTCGWGTFFQAYVRVRDGGST